MNKASLNRKIVGILIAVLVYGFSFPPAGESMALVRIKDIGRISGTREYQIIGYGLVTGLDGTGDKSAMSIEMVRGMLQNMGMDINKDSIETKNCAAVVVTAMIPPYGKAGETFDVTVSSIGDAKSLQGGVLLPTLLKGGDGQVYAVAQGSISIGGIGQGGAAAAGPAAGGGAAGGGTQSAVKHLTVGRVPNGAIQEREVGDKFGRGGSFSIVLQRKDLALSRRVKEAVERKFGDGWAKIGNPGTIQVTIPSSFSDDPVSFAATIEELTLSIEEPNRVVINERTGTVIVGNTVRIGRVVISQNGLRIEVGGQTRAAAPGTAGAPREPAKGSMISIQGETTVDDLVKALNAIGASPKDLISIFQAIDAAGALHGELKLM